jgi:hypothetical protein
MFPPMFPYMETLGGNISKHFETFGNIGKHLLATANIYWQQETFFGDRKHLVVTGNILLLPETKP